MKDLEVFKTGIEIAEDFVETDWEQDASNYEYCKNCPCRFFCSKLIAKTEELKNRGSFDCYFEDHKTDFISIAVVNIEIKIVVAFLVYIFLNAIEVDNIWFNGIIFLIIQIIMDIGATKIITNIICELLEKEGEYSTIDIHLSKKFLFFISTIIAIVSAILV